MKKNSRSDYGPTDRQSDIVNYSLRATKKRQYNLLLNGELFTNLIEVERRNVVANKKEKDGKSAEGNQEREKKIEGKK